jgi:acetyl esterase/lipase
MKIAGFISDLTAVMIWFKEMAVNGLLMTGWKPYWLGKIQKKRLRSGLQFTRSQAGALPAVLLLHGTKDETITIEVARRFQKALTERGGIAELGSFEGEEHGFFNANMPRFNEIYEMVYTHVMKYLVNIEN